LGQAPRRPGPGRALVLVGAALAGCGGLALEVVLLSCAGLALGYGRSAAIGLAVWIATWAVGAWVAGRSAGAPPRRFVALGLACLGAAGVSTQVLLWAGHRAPGSLVASVLGGLAIALAAFPQGLFLPWLARLDAAGSGRARDLSILFGANLSGSVLGSFALGDWCAGRVGRVPTAWIAGAASLVAALLAAHLARRARGAVAGTPGVAAPAPRALGRGAAGVVIGIATLWTLGLEWVGLRLGVLWLGDMQPALSAVLAASLIALFVGALALPPLVFRDARGVALLLALGGLATLWPLHAAPGLRALDAWLAKPREGGALPGAMPPEAIVALSAWVLHPTRVLREVPALRELAQALLLVGPALLPFGAVVPVVHRVVAGESGRRLGALLLHEAWGALLGVPLVHFFLVPRFGLAGALAGLCICGALAALALARATPRGALPAAMLCALGAVHAATARQPALDAPVLADPALETLAFTEDESFAVTVVDDGVRGERTLLTDAFRATAVGDDYLYMQVLGHLPVLLHPAPRRVAVLAFGTGTSAGAVFQHEAVRRIEVLELSRAVCEQAAFFEEVNHGVLAAGLDRLLDAAPQERVAVLLGDGRRRLAERPRRYDVITMEPLLPDSPFAVYLYTREFYARAREALTEGGLLCQWVPPHALEPAKFEVVVDAFTRAFPWSGVFLFGTQVILVGGGEAPLLDPERFPRADSALGAALAALGLEAPSGVMARFVASGASGPRTARPLRDADPWIATRPRGRGGETLLWLPQNLRLLRGREEDPPSAWQVAADADAWRRLEGIRQLHRAREVHEIEFARLFGREMPVDPELRPLEEYRTALLLLLPEDAEVQEFERTVRFEQGYQVGVRALTTGLDREARLLLEEAIAARPASAHVHLYLALALQRLGEAEGAAAEVRRAQELCPRILETVHGARAKTLGLGLPTPPPRRP